jgi:hypothetical protein
MKKLLFIITLALGLIGHCAHLSLGYYSHPFREETRTVSLGVKHFFYEDFVENEVGAQLGGVGLTSGKNGSVMAILTPMAFSPEPYYGIGVDLVLPLINKDNYPSLLLGVSINFSL